MRGGIFVWLPKRVFQNTKTEPKGSVWGLKVHSSIGENTYLRKFLAKKGR